MLTQAYLNRPGVSDQCLWDRACRAVVYGPGGPYDPGALSANPCRIRSRRLSIGTSSPGPQYKDFSHNGCGKPDSFQTSLNDQTVPRSNDIPFELGLLVTAAHTPYVTLLQFKQSIGAKSGNHKASGSYFFQPPYAHVARVEHQGLPGSEDKRPTSDTANLPGVAWKRFKPPSRRQRQERRFPRPRPSKSQTRTRRKY